MYVAMAEQGRTDCGCGAQAAYSPFCAEKFHQLAGLFLLK